MKRIFTLLILSVCLALSGCTNHVLPENAKEEIGKLLDDIISLTETETADTVETADPLEGVEVPDGFAAVVTDGVAFVGKTDKTRYYRSQLNEEEQKVYDEIYVIVDNMLGETDVTTLDTGTLELAAKAVMYDFPEFFYLTNYEYIQYMLEDKLKKLTFIGNYSISSEDRESCLTYIDDYFDVFSVGIDEDMSDYDIAKYLYEFIAFNTEYESESSENQNILSVMLYGKSVCSGYAKTYQYIMNRLGYETILVSGVSIKSGESHAWVIVRLDDEYYYVDPTWGDNPVAGVTTDYVSPLSVNYGYLCVPEEWILRTHKFDVFLPLPLCESLNDNYYVKNNIYIETCEPSEYDRVYDYFISQGFNTVTFRCASPEILGFWVRYLFEEQHVFDRMENNASSVSYTLDEDTFVITLLLS